MTSLPSILIAGSGLSPLAARLSLALPLLLPILLPFSWERWKGKGEYGVLYLDPTAATRDSFGLVLQLGELWHSLVGSGHNLFHITGSKELQTCSPVHKYGECCFFLNGIFFPHFPPVARNCKGSGKEEDCRGTQFPWASCRTHVQEIECRNYCMRGC